jgi:hypothetical protein
MAGDFRCKALFRPAFSHHATRSRGDSDEKTVEAPWVSMLSRQLGCLFELAFCLTYWARTLVRFGIVGTSIVTKNRRYIYAALFILVAMTTTDGGPVGDALLYLPMITLLELGV